ncbi:uncharacterized protein LOC116286945 [Actinia tenebrosa]|uniref:Uncharacterized protein LOC116286945 n=1 Tax=Actinia tenebrosa TaxID=6105 RepID=A0A6P8HA81_ACTTE|nr:uncharacterized protein LOC116286945 [Actinia tenebrosa]
MTKKKVLIIVIVLGVLSFVFFIAGIIFFATGNKRPEAKSVKTSCDYSEEAKRVGLPKLLQKAKDTYFEMHPERYFTKTEGISVKELKQKYKSYDPSPEKIKLRTDTARRLYQEIKNTKVNFDRMKEREIKAFFQLTFFVKFVFSTPYAGNYYNGDWMMGPDSFCYNPICDMPYYIENNLQNFKPSNVKDFEELEEKLKEVNETFFRYIENLKFGVKAGMVGTQESCYAGLQALILKYGNVYRKGEEDSRNQIGSSKSYDLEDGRVVKALDLSSNVRMYAWVRTPLLVAINKRLVIKALTPATALTIHPDGRGDAQNHLDFTGVLDLIYRLIYGEKDTLQGQYDETIIK